MEIRSCEYLNKLLTMMFHSRLNITSSHNFIPPESLALILWEPRTSYFHLRPVEGRRPRQQPLCFQVTSSRLGVPPVSFLTKILCLPSEDFASSNGFFQVWFDCFVLGCRHRRRRHSSSCLVCARSSRGFILKHNRDIP